MIMIPVVCQRCNNVVDLQDRYCKYCGVDLYDVFGDSGKEEASSGDARSVEKDNAMNTSSSERSLRWIMKEREYRRLYDHENVDG